jgi:hypothetical protein
MAWSDARTALRFGSKTWGCLVVDSWTAASLARGVGRVDACGRSAIRDVCAGGGTAAEGPTARRSASDRGQVKMS